MSLSFAWPNSDIACSLVTFDFWAWGPHYKKITLRYLHEVWSNGVFLFPCDSKAFAQHPFCDFKIVFIILEGGRDSFQKSVLSNHGALGDPTQILDLLWQAFFLTCQAISPVPQIQHYKARVCLFIFLRYPCDFHSPKYTYFPRDQKPQVPSRSGTKAFSFTGAEISMSGPLGFRWNRGWSKWEETSASF